MFEFGNTFYERLQNILEIQQILKSTFYNHLNISKQSAHNWKKGAVPSSDTLIAISKYLDVSPTWLSTGEPFEDSSSPTSPAQIYNRIINQLEIESKHKVYENFPDFYNPLSDIVAPLTLLKWFHGIQIPRPETLVKIAKRFNWSLDYLQTGVKEKYDIEYAVGDKLRPDEDLLISHYRCLDKREKDIATEIVYSLHMKGIYSRTIKQQKEMKKNEDFKKYSHYDSYDQEDDEEDN